MKKKISCGIILAKMTGNKVHFVCVRRRANYGFYDIINGNYDHKSNESILKRLRQTTIDEKYLLLGMNYDHMYFHAYGRYNYKEYAKTKFIRTFIQDGGLRLTSLIKRSQNEGYIWGIPKGRKKTAESDILCAIREFKEETNIPLSKYKILKINPIVYTHTDDKIIYESTYFIAVPRTIVIPRIDMKSKIQTSEIIETKWMSLEQMEMVFPPGLFETIRSNLKVIKKAILM